MKALLLILISAILVSCEGMIISYDGVSNSLEFSSQHVKVQMPIHREK